VSGGFHSLCSLLSKFRFPQWKDCFIWKTITIIEYTTPDYSTYSTTICINNKWKICVQFARDSQRRVGRASGGDQEGDDQRRLLLLGRQRSSVRRRGFMMTRARLQEQRLDAEGQHDRRVYDEGARRIAQGWLSSGRFVFRLGEVSCAFLDNLSTRVLSNYLHKV